MPFDRGLTSIIPSPLKYNDSIDRFIFFPLSYTDSSTSVKIILR